MRPRALVLFLVASLALWPQVAHGSEPELKEQKKAARALAVKAKGDYDTKQYDSAIKGYLKAYRTYPFPQILFNLAQAYRMANDSENAAFYYRAYLREMPEAPAPNRQEAEERLSEMESLEKAQRASRAQPPQGVVEPPSADDLSPSTGSGQAPVQLRLPAAHDATNDDWSADGWGWGLSGAGLLVGGVAAGLLLNSAQIESDARAASEFEAPGLYDKAAERRQVGIELAIAGGALLVGGVIKLALHDDARRSSTTHDVALGFGWIGLQGSF